MTKGGSCKTKTLGRLLFGEKRKSHTSPARHRSSTRNGRSSRADPKLSSAPDGTTTTAVDNNPINTQDWAAWRVQLNEHMGAVMADQRWDLKHIRQFLHSNQFYRQHSRDASNSRLNAAQLLFSIPRTSIKPEYLDGSRLITMQSNNNENGDVVVAYEDKNIRSNSDDRTTTSVNSLSAVQPMIIDKSISQLLPKGLDGNPNAFIQTNEQIVAIDRIQPRRSIRRSFVASERIHGTLQKAVKDGNVLEKIKAFEMQAAAAQAESLGKLGSGVNNRVQSVTTSIQTATNYRSSPAIIHPIQQTISPVPMQLQNQPTTRSHRSRCAQSIQQNPDSIQTPTAGHKPRKGAHALEPTNGDIILRRRTPSQKGINEEDCSITAISSMALTTSQGHHRNHHHYHHRKSASRSRHRQESSYDKRTPSRHEHTSHKHHHKTKTTQVVTPTPTVATPTSKPSTHRRWLKGRKETSTGIPDQDNKQEKQQTSSTAKSNKSSTNKKKDSKKEKSNTPKISAPITKEKLLSDNNRVYGVPNPDCNESAQIEGPTSKNDEKNGSEEKKNFINDTNTCVSSEQENINETKECDTVITMKIQRQPSKNSHQQRQSNIEKGPLREVEDDNRFSRPTDDHAHQSDLDDEDDDNDYDKSEDDVFIEDSPIKPTANIVRHQSVINLPNNEARRFQQQSSSNLRRHSSQCSSNAFTLDRRYLQSKETHQIIDTTTTMKTKPPITLITRKNKLDQDETLGYEPQHSEQTQIAVCSTHTLKKTRTFQTLSATSTNHNNNGQINNNSNNKQMSKQILHAIMNSMNNNQEQTTIGTQVTLSSSSINDEFFENGPLTNPEETIVNMTSLVPK